MNNGMPYPAEVRQEALKLMKEGTSAWQLSLKLGVSYPTTKLWKKAFDEGKFEVVPTRKICPKKIRQEALLLFQQGRGYKAVAKQLGLSIYTVRDWHRDFQNESFAMNPKRGSNISQSDKERILELHNIGLSRKEIASIMGIGFYSVRYTLRKYKE